MLLVCPAPPTLPRPILGSHLARQQHGDAAQRKRPPSVHATDTAAARASADRGGFGVLWQYAYCVHVCCRGDFRERGCFVVEYIGCVYVLPGALQGIHGAKGSIQIVNFPDSSTYVNFVGIF